MDDWLIFRGDGERRDLLLPAPPNWRRFDEEPGIRRLGFGHIAPSVGSHGLLIINAALMLRRPLLVTGPPGVGKSTLAYQVARELRLGPVLRWPITSRSSLRDGLYHYDAVGRLEATNRQMQRGYPSDDDLIGSFIRLGALGTALLPTDRPRVLLIDDFDKSDVDLPNDLLHVFEEGAFEIPELLRLADRRSVDVMSADDTRIPIAEGRIRCREFPFVVLTSNGDRDFPPGFLRQCIRLHMPAPDEEHLTRIVAAHLGPEAAEQAREIIAEYLDRSSEYGGLPIDQLLNAVFLVVARGPNDPNDRRQLVDSLMHALSSGEYG